MSARRSLGAALVVLLALGSAGCSAFGLDTAPEPGAHGGSAIVVGVSGDFAENQLVAEMYAQVLEHAGYDVRREFDLHSRESSQNALESGTIDVKPEYLSSLLLFMDPNAEASACKTSFANTAPSGTMEPPPSRPPARPSMTPRTNGFERM